MNELTRATTEQSAEFLKAADDWIKATGSNPSRLSLVERLRFAEVIANEDGMTLYGQA